ncbi:hypothetical protein AB0H83_10850 [Dactylosporangium sp. NPDC050688]|uniref:hypothetical protein n=1 Tax=Dactylosporangium sp. NPDC050688 TaxID=3157217 RepID=UPI0033C88680
MTNPRSPHDPGHAPPDNTHPPPDKLIPVPETLIRSTIDSLERLDEFFRRYASPGLRQDLRAYAQAQGWHPTTGPGALLDAIAFGAHALTHALNDRKDSDTSVP